MHPIERFFMQAYTLFVSIVIIGLVLLQPRIEILIRSAMNRRIQRQIDRILDTRTRRHYLCIHEIEEIEQLEQKMRGNNFWITRRRQGA